MKSIIQVVIVIFSLLSFTSAYAQTSPKFNADRKMKSKEVFAKCSDWASKQAPFKAGDSDIDAKVAKWKKLYASCNLNNGFEEKK